MSTNHELHFDSHHGVKTVATTNIPKHSSWIILIEKYPQNCLNTDK